MAPVRNGKVIFNEVPEGYPEVGKTVVYDDADKIDPDTVPLDGGVLIKNLVLSIDPYMRGKMRDPSKKSYSPAYVLGEPIDGYAIAKVVRSENPAYKSGDHVFGSFPFKEYAVLKELPRNARKIERVGDLPWTVYVGVCGMPGKTAYMGWKAYADAKEGETLFVTTGAGPVGSLVIQLAKMKGLKVIASAGSEDKVEFMKKIGADVAFNYKTQSTKDILEQHGPIDIYWDHVGGEVLDIALAAAAPHARFIEVGMISIYNTGPHPINNIGHVLFKSIRMQGFIVGNLDATYSVEFYREVPPLVASGKIQHLEYIKNGLENVGQMIVDVQRGHNIGKSVIVLADD